MSDNIFHVKDLHDPAVQHFRLKKDGMLRRLGWMVIDSEKVVLRAMQAHTTLVKILTTEDYLHQHYDLFAKYPDVPVFISTVKEMETIIGHRIHQGFIAIGQRPEPRPQNILGNKIVLLNHVVDPENVGTMCRCAKAFGFDDIIADEQTCSPFNRRAIRVSMGSVFQINVHYDVKASVELTQLREQGYKIFAAGLWDDTIDSYDIPATEKCVLVIGNEHEGIDADVKACCDLSIKIPINPGIDSLNAGLAGGMLLYEINRPR